MAALNLLLTFISNIIVKTSTWVPTVCEDLANEYEHGLCSQFFDLSLTSSMVLVQLFNLSSSFSYM